MDRLENQGHPFAEHHLVTSSVLFSTEEGSFRDATHLLRQDIDEQFVTLVAILTKNIQRRERER